MFELRNPYIFAPVKTGFAKGDGQVNWRHLAYYQQRSRHVGAVIPEPFYLAANLREIPTQMGIDGSDKIPGLKKLVSEIHTGGAAAVAHLSHPGRMANPKIPGNVYLSATDRPCEAGGAQPMRMEEAEMDEVKNLFVAAAKTAVAAGFDALELQFGHGYLLAQFLSPLVNDRRDEYGGNFEGRSRFPLEVLEAVRKAVDLPLIIRISGAEMITGGIEINESVALAKALKARTVEAVHVSAGTVCSTPPWFFQHMFIPVGKTWDLAEQIAREAGVKVVAVGRIDEVETARKLEKRFAGGYLAVGRGLVADPDLVGKFLGLVDNPVRPCLACAEGCLGGIKSGLGLQCLVNPQVGREQLAIETAKYSRKVAVIGGGLAGMQAAITLHDRGHEADLFEEKELGGQFNLAPLTPHKDSMGRLVPYFLAELDRRGIRIIAKRATVGLVASYDAVVVATGSQPRVPSIPGLEEYRGADILADAELPRNKHVLIIGGGLIGVDVATALIPRGNRITIVKRTTDFGEDMELIAKKLSLKIMADSGTTFSDRTHVQRVAGRVVHATRDEQAVVFEDVDLIVVTTGMRSVDDLARELQGAVALWVVGDARQVGNAQDAIADAYLTCLEV